MAEPGCALLPVLPSDSPHPQRLVSGNLLEAWLASLAESSVSTPFCLRSPCGPRGCALRPPSQGVGSAEGRASVSAGMLVRGRQPPLGLLPSF